MTTFKTSVNSINTVVRNGKTYIIASGDSESGELNIFNFNDFKGEKTTSMNYFIYINIYEK